MALKATIVALALSSVDSFAPAATGAPRRPAFAIIIRQTGTNLEALLKENGIETLALCGFLTNCCVESSMRTAYEKGFIAVRASALRPCAVTPATRRAPQQPSCSEASDGYPGDVVAHR